MGTTEGEKATAKAESVIPCSRFSPKKKKKTSSGLPGPNGTPCLAVFLLHRPSYGHTLRDTHGSSRRESLHVSHLSATQKSRSVFSFFFLFFSCLHASCRDSRLLPNEGKKQNMKSKHSEMLCELPPVSPLLPTFTTNPPSFCPLAFPSFVYI